MKSLQLTMPGLMGDDRRADALDVLSCYYGCGRHAPHKPFTGSWFDTWDSTGTRQEDVDHFTADDLVAVSFLSVDVPPMAAAQLLGARASEFERLLHDVPPDRDLVEETERWEDDWVGWTLWQELVDLPGVGATIASKLYARKRPRLRPIYDTVIAGVLGSERIWEPLRAHLQENPSLHPRLVSMHQELGLPEQVSALRVFDVITWMEGKGYTECKRV